MSLLEAAERFASIDRSTVTLDTAHCLHSLDRYADCEACDAICPVEAITPGKPPALDPAKCQTCLACLTVCPVGAYSADDAVTSLLNTVVHLEGNAVELICAKNAQAEKGISETCTGIRLRGCLAGLGTGTYLALSAFGLERIFLRTDACSTCQWATLHLKIESQVTQAQHLLAAWGKDEILACVSSIASAVDRPLWSADNPPLSRRDLFRMVARQGQVVMARALENGQVRAGHQPGRDRLRLLGAAAHLPTPEANINITLGEHGFASVVVSAACTACGVCARGCPTSALQFEKNEEERTYRLKFSARNCIGCELCLHVCAPSALAVAHEPTFAQIFAEEETITLREGDLVNCERCGVLMAKREDNRLCTLCEYRRTHPFGSVLPPGLKGIRPQVPEKKRA